MTREMPKEREARLLRQRDYMHRRTANNNHQLQAKPYDHTTAKHSQDVSLTFDDPVIAKLAEFHQHLLSIEIFKMLSLPKGGAQSVSVGMALSA